MTTDPTPEGTEMSEPIEATATAVPAPDADDVEAERAERPAPAEALHPEVVQPGTAIEQHDETQRQLIADLAQIPGKDEFYALAAMARVLAGSALVPKDLRGKPQDVFLILLTGRDVGIPTTSALRKVYVVDGQPTLAPQLRLALVRQKGLGRIVPHPENSDRWAGAIALGPSGEQLGPITEFTWEDAQNTGMVRGDCAPDQHSDACIRIRKDGNRGGCKSNYVSYPKRMLWWRAAGYAVDDYFPEVSMGLYSPDELGALTDEEGKPIDPANVSVPEGFETKQQGRSSSSNVDPETGEVAAGDQAELWSLQERIASLPDEWRKELRDRWQKMARLKGIRVSHLPADRVQLAASMIRGVEAQAKAKGWDPDDAMAATRERIATVVASLPLLGLEGTAIPPQEPVEAPDASDASDAAREAENDAEGEGPPPLAEDDRTILRSTPPETLKAFIEDARKLTGSRLDTALTEANLSKTGNVDTKRQRLVLHWCRTAANPQDEFEVGDADPESGPIDQ